MKKTVLLFMFTHLLFGQITTQITTSGFCDTKKESLYYKLTHKPFVKIQDKAIYEITKGLSTLSLSKRKVVIKDSSAVFIHFKIHTFLSQNSSKYITYENSLTIAEAKSYLLDVITMEEEYRKNQVTEQLGYFSSFNNTAFFMKTGYEFLKEPIKSSAGQIKRDKNGDEIISQSKNWFIDLDTSCRDNKTKYEIDDILSYIELVRNTINS